MANTTTHWLLPKARVDELFDLLRGDGFEILGPRIDQEAIIYGPIRSAAELPIGWGDEQGPGHYRLRRRADDAYFGYAVGPHSWKQQVFPASIKLWEARREAGEVRVHPEAYPRRRRALVGVRACELHALAVQDRVFLDREDGTSDRYYTEARRDLFLIGVDCQDPGGTCFCASVGTGPEVPTDRIPLPIPDEVARATVEKSRRLALPLVAKPAPQGAFVDLVWTELPTDFVVQAVSDRAKSMTARLQLQAAAPEQIAEAKRRVADARTRMGRSLDSHDVRGLLRRNQEHPRWDDAANRCLTCTNCTLVCPTCFCSSVEDENDFSNESAARYRRWDSCFNPEFARVHGGNFRASPRARYRQWLTHKFSAWYDQFGVSGCVGCGRCITWCPVGIDVTEEIAAIRAADGARQEQTP